MASIASVLAADKPAVGRRTRYALAGIGLHRKVLTFVAGQTGVARFVRAGQAGRMASKTAAAIPVESDSIAFPARAVGI